MLIFFSKLKFIKKFFQEYPQSVSNSLEPDQAQHFVGPDLGPNCLQSLSALNASRRRVKGISFMDARHKWVDHVRKIP